MCSLLEELKFVKELMEQKGYKFTSQRRVIIEELFNVEKHLKFEELYDKIKDRNIGQATVYRSLKLFTDLDIIKAINVDGVNYYEKKIYCKKPLHIHFKCKKCNSIIDINDIDTVIAYLKLNKMIEKNNDVQIHDIDIMLSGLCQKCLEGVKCQDR